MKKYNKLLSAALILAMCISTVSPAFAKDYDAENGTVHVSGSESWQGDDGDRYDHVANDDYEVNISGETNETVVEVSRDTSSDIQVNISDVTADVDEGPAADIQGGNVTIEDSSLSTKDENSAAVELGGNADVTVSGDTTVTGNGTGIEMKDHSSLTVESGATLEVNGSQTDVTGSATVEGGNTGIQMEDNSSVTVESGGTLEANGSNVNVDVSDDTSAEVEVEGGNTGIDMNDQSSVTVDRLGSLEANGSSVELNGGDKAEVTVDGGNTGVNMEDKSVLTVEDFNKKADLSGTEIVTGTDSNLPETTVSQENNKAVDMSDSSQIRLGGQSNLSAVDTKVAEKAAGENFGSFTSNKYGYYTYFYPNIDPHTKYPDNQFKVGATGTVTEIEMKVGENASLDRQPAKIYQHNTWYCGQTYEYNPTNYADMNMTMGTGGVVELDKYSAKDTGEYYKGLQAQLSGTMPGETTVELDYYAYYGILKETGYCSCGDRITLPADSYWYSYKAEAVVKVNADYQLNYDLGDFTAASFPDGTDPEDLTKTSTVARTLESFAVTDKEPEREGYTFQGGGLKDENGNWVTDKNGKPVLYKNGDSVTLQWAEGLGGSDNPVKLTLVANWAEVGDPDEPDPDKPNPDKPDPDKPDPDKPDPDKPDPDKPDPDEPDPDKPDPDKPDPDEPDPDEPDPDEPDPDRPDPTPTPDPVVVPDPDVPLVEEPVVEVPVENVPLAEIPKEVEVPDEDVPLANVPKTGDISALWYLTTLLSACALTFLGLRKKDRS